ncbi:MAG: ParA family protein [Patescibacteria group bacterium]|nr:ParA family protein [Patescibacteria group bacterium]
MAKVIAVVNQKGGVGKTTSAVSLGAYLAQAGKFVLLVDLDPQANATSGVGVVHQELTSSIYHVLTGQTGLRQILKPTPHEGYRIAPASAELAGARVELVNITDREYKLQQALLEVKSDFDIVLIDCPPSLDLLTVNGLVAADHLLIPIQSEYYALEGLGQLLQTIDLVRERLKPELSVLGGLVTMFDARNKLSQQVLDELKAHFPYPIFQSIVPRNVRLSESPSYGQTILQYDPGSRGGRAYQQLAQEVLQMLQQAEAQNYAPPAGPIPPTTDAA